MRLVLAPKLIAISIALITITNADDQVPPRIPPISEAEMERPPSGMLTGSIGQLISVEGLLPKDAKGNKNGSARFQVDTVNGVRLKGPRRVKIGGLDVPRKIPRNVRCVLKGYETGKMVGTPPALRQAAEELGKEYRDGRQKAGYGWSTSFVVLYIVDLKSIMKDRITEP